MSETCSIRAYSLPEVLITLLIISLIASFALAKMVKYKSRSNSVTNYWICTRDADGNYIVDTSSTNAGEAKSDRCEFISPTNFKSLKVNVVGGGGGGASGRGVLDQVTYTNGEHSYIPSNTGSYFVILIGAGGESGKNRKKCGNSQGGGSGGVIAGNVNLIKDAIYTINIGKASDGGDYNGHAGDPTTMSGGGLSLAANGGKGGRGEWGLRCKNGGATGDGGTYSGTTGRNGVRGGSLLAQYFDENKVAIDSLENADKDGAWPTPGRVCVSDDTNNTTCLLGLERFLGESISPNIGAGGLGGKSKTQNDGSNGYAKIMYSPVYGGGGGMAGIQSFSEIKKSVGKVNVYIGEGGKGATTANAPGDDGEASRFGDIIIASGGEGGKIMANNTNISTGNANPVAAGAAGVKTPLQSGTYGVSVDGSIPSGGMNGGNSSLNGWTVWGGPGSGGGGGAGSSVGTGNGADGAYGAVIVTW